jgi:hypothetical protein
MNRLIWSGLGLCPLLRPPDAREVFAGRWPVVLPRTESGRQQGHGKRRTHPATRGSKRTAPGLHCPNHALLSSCAARRMPLPPIVPGSISDPWPPRRRAPPHASAVPMRGDPPPASRRASASSLCLHPAVKLIFR